MPTKTFALTKNSYLPTLLIFITNRKMKAKQGS
jgi:hypothetical protein